MWKNYLRSFIIGSSWPIFIPFFYGVANLYSPKIFNYSYQDYTFIAPVYLGLMNVIATFIGLQFKLSLSCRLLIGSIISFSTVFLITQIYETYKTEYLPNVWQHYGQIFLTHFLVFNFIIYYLELWLGS